ncbi:MAG TPA: hypothetical protein VHM92_11040 [Allosphingosinicella sp.]|nr:hypothetical protein [Allosphingosinicella sp.]
MARLAPLAAVAAAEAPRDPFDTLLRSFDLTRGRAGPVFLYMLVLNAAVIGILNILPVGGAGSPRLLEALADTAAGLFGLVIQAGLYRCPSAPGKRLQPPSRGI